MDFYHSIWMYGLLLGGMAGNLILPYCWGAAWSQYSFLKRDTLLLSDPDSPVRWFQRLWRVLLGTIFILGGIMLYQNLESRLYLDLVSLGAMIGYGALGCIIPAVFSLTDIKYVDSVVAKIHNVIYIIGHICLQIAAICTTAVAFEQGDSMRGAIFSIIAFICTFVYAIYNMSDRLECRDTIFENEGAWEWAFHLLAYLPLAYTTILYII